VLTGTISAYRPLLLKTTWGNKLKKNYFAAFLLASLLSVSASATVIDFESTGSPGTYNTLDYAIDGFRFSTNMDNIDISSTSGYSGSGPAHSGNYVALNNHGFAGNLTREDGATFSFQSLWVRNWYDAGSVRTGTVTGFLNGVEVGRVSGESSGTWNQIVGNFSQIDRLNFDFGNFFLVDDFTLNAAEAPAGVPEPGSLALLGLGLAGLLASKKRSRR
jgi:hypothetical protein